MVGPSFSFVADREVFLNTSELYINQYLVKCCGSLYGTIKSNVSHTYFTDDRGRFLDHPVVKAEVHRSSNANFTGLTLSMPRYNAVVERIADQCKQKTTARADELLQVVYEQTACNLAAVAPWEWSQGSFLRVTDNTYEFDFYTREYIPLHCFASNVQQVRIQYGTYGGFTYSYYFDQYNSYVQRLRSMTEGMSPILQEYLPVPLQDDDEEQHWNLHDFDVWQLVVSGAS